MHVCVFRGHYWLLLLISFLYLYLFVCFAFFCTTLWVWHSQTRLPRHCCPCIMHLLWSLKPSHNLTVGQRCTLSTYTDPLSDPKRYLTLILSSGHVYLIRDQLLRQNATSWTSVSVSLLILECQNYLQVALKWLPKRAHPLMEILSGWGRLGSECETLLLSSWLPSFYTQL